MNWESLGAVSEFVAAIAVVASLLYLAIQVRDTKNTTQSATYFQATEYVNAIFLSIAESPELSRIYFLGNADPSKLTPDELPRYMIIVGSIFARYNNYYLQHENGTLPEEAWQIAARHLRLLMANPGIQSWWKSSEQHYLEGFKRLLDSALEECRGRAVNQLTNHRENLMSEVPIRPATKADCGKIAALYSISSDGVADYIWTKLAESGENILDVGRRRYEREGTAFSYENCTVVESEGQVIGMLVAFPMHINPTEVETDPVLAPYSKLEEDNSYYICGMAMFPEYRGLGVGTQLLALAEQHAVDKGFRKLSLIVFEENTGAKRLYERHGYTEVAREPVYPHPLIHYTGDAVLMVKAI